MARGGVLLRLAELPIFNAATINPGFGCVAWHGGVGLCPEAMHQAISGSESEAVFDSVAALREGAKKNQ